MQAHVRRIAMVLVLTLALAGPAFASGPLGASLGADAGLTRAHLPRAHPSIVIEGDAGFAAEGSGVVAGTGTASDPYVIAGWSIVHTRAAAIRLVDTRAHVVIQDVYLEGQESEHVDATDCFIPPAYCDGSHGIGLLRAENVTVRNVRILGESAGMRILSSRDVLVADVAIGVQTPTPARPVTGIHVQASQDVVVVNATIRGATTPVRLFQATNVTLADSHLVGGASSRVQVSQSDGLTFARGLYEGILFNFQRTGTATYVDNVFSGGSSAIFWTYFSGTDDHFDALNLCGNTFRGFTGAALRIEGAGSVTARGNTFADNFVGVDVLANDALVFERNDVTRSSGAGAFLLAPGARVHNNSFEDNEGGVSVTEAGSDASHNWWGDASGPSGLGPGTGDAFHDHSGSVPYAPWLASKPSLAVACEAPATPAPQAHAPFHVEASAEASVYLKAKADVLGVPVRVDETRAFTLGTGPVLLP